MGWVRPHFASLGAGYADDLSCRLNAIDLSFSTISLISFIETFLEAFIENENTVHNSTDVHGSHMTRTS